MNLYNCKELPTPLFDAKTVTRDTLLALIVYWWPSGSGPLGMMKIIVWLYAQIAELRGFDPITMEELRDTRHIDAEKHLMGVGIIAKGIYK